jgi:hypothetical protein
MREVCVAIARGRAAQWTWSDRGSHAWEPHAALVAGLIESAREVWSLTPAGRVVAADEELARAAVRERRNAAGRARSGAMRDLGMVRTRNGGWE